ncbi:MULTISPECIES: sensor domain-containing diguanylate cyclase [Pseudoxanthomonas]|jgi:diguanylate cyclase (GGDEF)-like protein|uniref:diguanylate cyclase n=1 Tax=Pseudoxanthomonas winnipegensis TaxID=2480810 RepID=A0A4Q8LD06_9GAMM|nr:MULTISPECIES: diguanylate cyclase [Pseudoxanthomonas]TAA26777.1 diguanylate cyclase [Pseudoxanthomonas winnipegensis]TMN16069.1 diguanylate cyclase [Pseudoxanthomonas sp. X-1]UAY75434.1 diguanylate cyclase [Pseudoxanthomonas sp. X-1]
MFSKRRLINQIGPLLATVIFVLIGLGFLRGADRFATDARWVSHTHEVMACVDEIEARLRDAESAERGYLLTGQVDDLAAYQTGKNAIPRLFTALGMLVRDNSAQEQRVAQLRTLIDQRLRQTDAVVRIYQEQGLVAAQAAIDAEARITSDAIRRQAREMVDVEQALLVARAASSDESAALLRILAIAGIPIGILVIAMVYVLMVREIRGRGRAERRIQQSNARLEATVAELEHTSGDLRVLSHFAGMLQSCVREEEALALTRETMQQLMPGTGGIIYRIRASQDYAEAIGGWGTPAAASAAMLAPEDCWALRRGQPQLAPGPGTVRCRHIEGGHGATACIPLLAQGQQLGFLYVSCTDDAFLARVRLIETAAEQLAMALSNLQLQERLRIQSIREPLTGLFNRRYLEESLARELARCTRRGLPLALMMMDLDHFKRFNDTHGHPGGDALLEGFGQLLLQLSREEDIACRYGGEEFTLILPEATPQAAAERAEQIRAAVETMRVRHLGKDLPAVTVSIGLACFPQDGQEPELLLRSADQALYRAKAHGRNRVEGSHDSRAVRSA